MSLEGGLEVPGGLYGGGHHPAVLPNQGVSLLTLSSSFRDATNGILTDSLALGVSPYHQLPYAFYAARLWAVFGIAESGADGSNFTTVEWRYGASFASYTVLGSINTQGNPAAGAVVKKAIPPIRMQPGLTVFAVATRTGAASVNFDTERISIGVDFQAIRVA